MRASPRSHIVPSVNEARLALVRDQERLIASEQARRERELAVLVARRG